MSTENNKTNEPHIFIISLADKLNLKDHSKNTNLTIRYTWRNIKSAYNYNKFKISGPTWNEEFDLPDGSYSIVDIQDYLSSRNKKL